MADQTDETIPFQNQTFSDFVGLLGRLFYDDACIVLLDFLAREQKSFLQSDIREKLGWRDTLIQQKLYLLEKHSILIEDLPINQGPRTPSHWRISHQLYGAIQWRYLQILDRLAKLVEDASMEHEFECSRRGCGTKYSALEAASCNRALDDEHPLCSKCGAQLKSSEFEETKVQAREKRAKALQQLMILNQGLSRMERMEIPIFPHYTKKDKMADTTESLLQPSPPPQETPTVSPSASIISDSSIKKENSNVNIKFATPAATPATPASRSIPWFDTGVAGNESLTQQTNHPSAPSSKISFGLKTANKLNSITRTPSSGFDSSLKSSDTNNTQLNISIGPQSVIPSTSIVERLMIGDQIEIEVKQLGRKFKLGEITEEIEHLMSDAEYKIYYNSSDIRF